MEYSRYRNALKREGITMKEFAGRLHVSKPTMYAMIRRYDEGMPLSELNQSVFDAFFGQERRDMYESRNGNLVVEIVENSAVNGNGTFVKGSETRGKRDIVVGRVIVSNPNYAIGSHVYFPYYAAQPFELDGKRVAFVDGKDIKMVRKGE